MFFMQKTVWLVSAFKIIIIFFMIVIQTEKVGCHGNGYILDARAAYFKLRDICAIALRLHGVNVRNCMDSR